MRGNGSESKTQVVSWGMLSLGSLNVTEVGEGENGIISSFQSEKIIISSMNRTQKAF